MRTERSGSDGSTRRAALRRCGVGGAALLVVVCAGCGYPRVEPLAYDVARALHTVFNQRDPQGLDRARAYLQQALSEDRLTRRDHDLLSSLVDLAAQGEWARAERETFRLLADQNDG